MEAKHTRVFIRPSGFICMRVRIHANDLFCVNVFTTMIAMHDVRTWTVVLFGLQFTTLWSQLKPVLVAVVNTYCNNNVQSCCPGSALTQT